MSASNGKAVRKRHYRQRVTCLTCKKEVDSDYKEGHIKMVHNGEKVNFSVVVEEHQLQINSFFVSSAKPPKRPMVNATASESTSCSSISCSDIAHDAHPLDKNGNQNQSSAKLQDPTEKITVVQSQKSEDANEVVECHNQSSNILSDLEMSFDDTKLNQSQTPSLNVQSSAEIFTINHWSQESVEACCSNEPSINSSRSSFNLHDSRVDFQSNQPSIPSLMSPRMSNHPILKEYNRKKFGHEKSSRDFNPQWYNTYPWISYNMEQRHFVCFACQEFMADNTFSFDNWKKSDRLKKHAKSRVHKDAMARWISSKINENHKTSVMKQLVEAHQKDVQRNREYLRVIITSIFYTAQQSVSLRGHEENRKNISEMSDTNRGNLLELLHLRCEDIPWLKEKLQSQLKCHAQWTSPSIQNEILDIISSFVIERITHDVLLSRNFALIMDETSDISRAEQVSICLRHVLDGKTLETFVGFFSTESTEGEILFKLVKKVITEYGLKLENIVGECFDGASNMSGVRKGVAARMKEYSPRGVYVHCYAHVLNLALQDTMNDVEPLRNALGTLQSLYNFLEGSTKRHALFHSLEVDSDHLVLTLKSLSDTRWSCRWEAVKAVTEQMSKIVKALLIFANDKDKRTYTDSRALINAICNFDFVFGVTLLKVILLNTNSLSKYLQGKDIDVITAKRNADLTMKTLRNCRNEKCFELLWNRAKVMSDEIKSNIKESDFVFKEARAPRNKPSRRLQALIGEPASSNTAHVITPQTHHRINTFYRSLDKVLSEMQ